MFSSRPYISPLSHSMCLTPYQVLWEITNLVWSAFMSWPNSFFLHLPLSLAFTGFFSPHSSYPLYHSPPRLQASLPHAPHHFLSNSHSSLHFFFFSLFPIPPVLRRQSCCCPYVVVARLPYQSLRWCDEVAWIHRCEPKFSWVQLKNKSS